MGELCGTGQTRTILNLMCGDARNPQLAHTTMSRAHTPTGYSSASGVGNIKGLLFLASEKGPTLKLAPYYYATHSFKVITIQAIPEYYFPMLTEEAYSTDLNIPTWKYRRHCVTPPNVIRAIFIIMVTLFQRESQRDASLS